MSVDLMEQHCEDCGTVHAEHDMHCCERCGAWSCKALVKVATDPEGRYPEMVCEPCTELQVKRDEDGPSDAVDWNGSTPGERAEAQATIQRDLK